MYPTTFAVEIGIEGAAGFSIRFTSPQAAVNYLPAVGPVGPLVIDVTNPASTSAGGFGGDVVALQFDVDFSDAALLPGTSGYRFGDVTLCDFPSLPQLEALTVRQYLAIVNTLLGGGSSSYAIDQLTVLTDQLTFAFSNGLVSQFARDHLVVGACP